MRFISQCLILLSFILFYSCTTDNNKLTEEKTPLKNYWSAFLQLNGDKQLPFLISINKDSTDFQIYNDEEVIKLTNKMIKGDSLIYEFDTYNNYLILKIEEKTIQGYFVQPDRTNHKRIPLFAKKQGKNKPKEGFNTTSSVDGKWKVNFNAYKDDFYPAIGKFNQRKNGRITGTFMTETGDYRFLDGYLSGQNLTLSTFDGSHAFLFEAKVKGDSLKGSFYSGSHWKTNWVAQKNDTFRLSDPNELTYLVKDTFKFEFPTVDNDPYFYPNKDLQGKITIIQILGTWCPNCMDETNFYKDLYDKYHNQGLEIIGVAYEYPSVFEKQVERVNNYTKALEVPYSILIGGKASKSKAASDFNMLNDVSSFPTSIFINKKGEVVKIHTGFNGPGTGDVYDEYVKKTTDLIVKLINE
ncbi:MAG: TlpA disulfide reductase family protein [Brumimicrobium sp.]